MRCLILTNHFLPESFRCNDVAFDLARRGYAVTVLTAIPDYPKGHYHKGYSLFKRRLEVIDGVKIIRVPVFPRGNGGALRLVLNYVSGLVSFFFYALYQSLFHKYDCIFVHDTSPAFIALPAVLIKKIRKTPIDLWILDMWPQSLTAGGINSPMVFSLVDRMMDHIYRNCSVIHISSYGFRKLLAERGVSDDKIKYLPNWSDDSIVLSSETVIPELPNGFRIMFAGNMGEAQNLENVLAAAALLKEHRNIHWIFLGDGRKKAWVEEFVSRNGLSATVHLLGRFPIASMPSFFKEADVMLVSLQNKLVFELTLPAKVQAYMSCSKPILAMLDGEGQEVVLAANCGWCVSADDVTGLAETVLRLSTTPAEVLKNKGKNGYNYYNAHFQKSLCLDALDEELRRIGDSIS